MTKENTVAVIYHCKEEITNRARLQRRLQRAIEDMVEDGFSNFILPIEGRNPFPETFIDAITAERSHNPNIRLTMMRPYEDELFTNRAYTKYAEEIIYNQQKYICGEPTNQVDNLLERSSALIIYYDRYSPRLRYIINRVQQRHMTFINIPNK